MQIEPGKYYRTRDGRQSPKVLKECGVNSFELETPIDGEITVLGNGFIKIDKKPCGGDFVAEWTDDPETLTVSRVEFAKDGARVYLSNGMSLGGIQSIDTVSSINTYTVANIGIKIK